MALLASSLILPCVVVLKVRAPFSRPVALFYDLSFGFVSSSRAYFFFQRNYSFAIQCLTHSTTWRRDIQPNDTQRNDTFLKTFYYSFSLWYSFKVIVFMFNAYFLIFLLSIVVLALSEMKINKLLFSNVGNVSEMSS